MGKFANFCAGVGIQVAPAKKVRHILVNVPNEGISDKSIKNVHQMVSYLETEILFLDSGGYQLFCAERDGKKMSFDSSLPLAISDNSINITDKHVIEVARRMKPHMMTSLDFPIKTLSDKNDQEREFMNKLGYNVLWARETAALREKYCPQIQLFIPVQCYNLDQFEKFSGLIKDVKFDGYSMPLRNLSITETALFLLRFYQAGIKMVHMLGAASFFVIALGTYMARNLFEWVSLDATSWREGAQFGIYFNPLDLSDEHLSGDTIIDENIPIFCGCPFCKDRTFTYIKNLPLAERTALLRSHNFWVTEKAADDLYNNSSDPLTLKSFLQKRSGRKKDIDELIQCLSVIDLMKNEDINIVAGILNS